MSAAPFVVLIGRRRMEDMARRLADVAPGVECVIVPSTAEALPHLDRAEVVVTMDRVTPAFLGAPKLRWLHLYPTGIDHVVIPELRAARFPITHKVMASVVPMAEHLLGVLLAIVRRLPEYRDLQRDADWRPFSAWPGTELRQLQGATLGIVGLGQVGRAVARRAKAFDMRVIATRRKSDLPAPEVDLLLPPEGLPELLAASAFVLALTPLNDATFHLFDADAFARMKRDAWFLNISRGPVVDEQALILALESGTIAGAALDVFEEEPLPPDSPLWRMPNVLITPHVSGSGPANAADAAEEIARNFARFLIGEPLEGLVDPLDIPTTFQAPSH
jgi:phosphoglycerate dehydrogenase-like enzyme